MVNRSKRDPWFSEVVCYTNMTLTTCVSKELKSIQILVSFFKFSLIMKKLKMKSLIVIRAILLLRLDVHYVWTFLILAPNVENVPIATKVPVDLKNIVLILSFQKLLVNVATHLPLLKSVKVVVRVVTNAER